MNSYPYWIVIVGIVERKILDMVKEKIIRVE